MGISIKGQKNPSDPKRRSKWKTALLFIAGVCLILGIAFAVYVSDYYHSKSTLAGYQQEYREKNIDITEDGGIITLKGNTENGIGIIFYPGGKVEYTAYIPLLAELAEQGYDCFLPKMPCNLAVFGVNRADTIIEENKDIETWYLAGHSLGGAMASSYAAQNSKKLEGIVFLGAYPSSDLSKTELSMLSIVGSNDGVINREKYEETKVNAPNEAVYDTLEGGNHAYYGDYGEQSGDGTADITPEEQIARTAEWIGEFCQ